MRIPGPWGAHISEDPGPRDGAQGWGGIRGTHISEDPGPRGGGQGWAGSSLIWAPLDTPGPGILTYMDSPGPGILTYMGPLVRNLVKKLKVWETIK